MTYTTEEIRACAESDNPYGALPEGQFDLWLAEHERRVAERVWDEVINVMKYEDGTPVELVTNINPYRSQP